MTQFVLLEYQGAAWLAKPESKTGGLIANMGPLLFKPETSPKQHLMKIRNLH